MNNRLFFVIGLTAIMASCQRVVEWSGAPEIMATVETEQETKTSLSVNSNGAGTIYWNATDMIDVFFGTLKATYTSQNTSNAVTATFKTSDSISDSDLNSSNIWGLYPSNSSSTCDGSSVRTTLPSTQYGVPNTFDDDLFPALAHSTSTSLQFYNVCGGIKFSLSRSDIKLITFKGNNDEDLAGRVTLSFSDGLPQATVVSGVKEITLTPKQGQTFASNVYYFIIALPATLSKGFKMTFLTTDGTIGTLNYTGSVTVRRSVFSKKERIDSYTDDWATPFSMNTSIYWSKNGYGDIRDSFEFNCEGSTLIAESNVLYQRLFDLFPIDHATFDTVYPEFVAIYDETDPLGTVEYDTTIPALRWTIPAEQLWIIASDPYLYEGEVPVITRKVAFVAVNGAEVVLTLKADVTPAPPYKIPTSIYVDGNWDMDCTFTRLHSFVPYSGETDNTSCVFHNNINAPFATTFDGVIDLTGVGGEGLEVSNIQYYFCDDMEEITYVGDYSVKFTVEDGEGTRTDVNGSEFDVTGYNTILKATIDGVESEIAYICNDAVEKQMTPNVVVLVKDEDPNHNAKKLLNTNVFYVLMGAKGMICGDEDLEVYLWWQSDPVNHPYGAWQDHFRANYIQPVNVTSRVKGNFVDGVDFGQEGSYIAIKDLVVLYDWRLDANYPSGHREFGMNPSDQYYNYWDFYGDCEIFIDPIGIKCDLTENGSVPASIQLMLMSKAELLASITDPNSRAVVEAIDDRGFGFLTYRCDTINIKAFNIYVPVAVQYGWGVISPDEPVTIHVESMISY